MGNDSINPENDNDEEDEALYRSRVRVEGAELVTPPVRVTTFSALKVRDYRWFWLSTLAGSASMQMQILGRLWLVYALTGSALALGIVAAARGGAILIFSLYGGAVADRVKKRNLLLVTQSANAVVALAIAILISTGAIIWQHLIIAAVLNGLVFSFNSPGRQSFIPELVGEREMLTNGIALYNTAMNLMRIIIPVIAGALVLVIGVAGVYYIGAACYAVSIVALLMIPASRKAGPRPDSSVGRDLIEGLGYVRRSPIILILLVMAFVAAIFAMPYSNFMPVFAVDILEAGPTGLGWLLTMTGIGALAGSLGVASLANFRRKGLLLLISAIAFGAMLILFCFSHSFALSLLLLVGVGLGMACYMTLSNALIQQNTTHEVRGRVMSIYMMTFGLMPLGALPLGAIADRVGAPSTLSIAAAIATTFIVLMAILRPQLRRLE